MSKATEGPVGYFTTCCQHCLHFSKDLDYHTEITTICCRAMSLTVTWEHSSPPYKGHRMACENCQTSEETE